MKLQDASLQFYEKKLFHTSSFKYFNFIFSKCITITSSEVAVKVCEHNSFQWKVVLLICDYDLSLHVEYGIWGSLLLCAVFVK